MSGYYVDSWFLLGRKECVGGRFPGSHAPGGGPSSSRPARPPDTFRPVARENPHGYSANPPQVTCRNRRVRRLVKDFDDATLHPILLVLSYGVSTSPTTRTSSTTSPSPTSQAEYGEEQRSLLSKRAVQYQLRTLEALGIIKPDRRVEPSGTENLPRRRSVGLQAGGAVRPAGRAPCGTLGWPRIAPRIAPLLAPPMTPRIAPLLAPLHYLLSLHYLKLSLTGFPYPRRTGTTGRVLTLQGRGKNGRPGITTPIL